jgi:hypothetical protein
MTEPTLCAVDLALLLAACRELRMSPSYLAAVNLRGDLRPMGPLLVPGWIYDLVVKSGVKLTLTTELPELTAEAIWTTEGGGEMSCRFSIKSRNSFSMESLGPPG